MARRGDVMHYTLDLCKDRKAGLSGIFGRRREAPSCQHCGRARQGGRFWPNADLTPIKWLSWAHHGVNLCTEAGGKEREGKPNALFALVKTETSFHGVEKRIATPKDGCCSLTLTSGRRRSCC